MKKIITLFLVILLVSGCSLVKIEEQSFEEIIDSIFVENDLKSYSLEGYSYYLPQGVILKKNDYLNSIFGYHHRNMYLYVDLVSYYHKVDSNYEVNKDAYYSLLIDKNGYKGYLEIHKISDRYFIEFMYRYSKMESYAEEEDLKHTVTAMAYILNSIKFNDDILESLIGENSLDYSEEQFNIFKPNGQESNFLDYIEEYDQGRIDSKDEDIFELEDSLE